MADVGIYEQLREHTGTSRGLGIPDEDTHQDRLRAAAVMLRQHKVRSVLDVGCGYGDLRMHILWCRYLGIDVHEFMIEEARRRLPATPFKTVSLADFTPQPLAFEAVVALGVLSTVPPEELGAFMDLLARQAGRCMMVSFLPSGTDYAGKFHTHALRDVRRGLPLLGAVEKRGELTVLLRLS